MVSTTATTEETSDESPMIIPIHSAEEAPEWAMLELNGELIMPKGLAREAAAVSMSLQSDGDDENSHELLGKGRIELGSLKFTNEGTPKMVVGSHELKGKTVSLKEPFALLKKRKRDDSTDYEVIGVVTKKLLFDEYPKSIMR